MRRFFHYIGCTIVIGIILYLGVTYQVHIRKEGEMTFNVIPIVVFSSIFPIIIGMVLRLPKLLIEVKEKKAWTVDWVKLAAIGLPSLYITSLPILLYTTSFGTHLFLGNAILLTGNSQLIITTTGIVFGYTLIDSLKK
jgi:hypothetical protein